VMPVTFNAGQILLGLACGADRFGEPYTTAMLRTAEWLIYTQDADGCWRKYPSPFVAPGEKTYYTHVAWGLVEAARISGEQRYADSALRNVNWALTRQLPNGWFANCCLNDPTQPLTHTIGYALRGIVEVYRYVREPGLLRASCRTAEGLLQVIDQNGFLPGRLDAEWRGTVNWACLTGSVQIAACLLLIENATGDRRLRKAATALNRYVRRTLDVSGPPDTAGGIKGSFPVSGGYGTYEYLSWANKFFLDSHLLEMMEAG
jgi:hypothetical protein